MQDDDVRVMAAMPAAVELVCAVKDREPERVEEVLCASGADLFAICVVLAAMVPDDVPLHQALGTDPPTARRALLEAACR